MLRSIRSRRLLTLAMSSRPPAVPLSGGLPGGDWSSEPVVPISPSPPRRSMSTPAPRSSTAAEKGKGRADAAPGSPVRRSPATATLSSMLEEALHSPLDISPPTLSPPSKSLLSSTSPQAEPFLARPPPAHHVGPPGVGLRPRLMTRISSTSAPTSSLSFPGVEEYHPRARELYVSTSQEHHQWELRPNVGSSAHFHQHTLMERHSGSSFPELDPATGLPLTRQASGEENRHLQRTISEQWRRGTDPPKTLFAMPSMPSLPTFEEVRRSVDGQRRQISTSTSALAQRMFSTSKSRVDSMLSEEDQAATKEEQAEKHKAKYRTPKNPIVLCHGLLGFDFLGPVNLPALQISHWRGIRQVLEKNGCEVLICRVPATGSIMERAEVLHKSITERFSGRAVNLIAHSMGGLDCRYLASQIKPTEFGICSLTTVSTPHRGSPFADYVIDNVIGRERLAQLLGIMQAIDLPNSGDGAAFTALGTRAMKEFNTEVIDHPDVKYYSWGASFEPGLFDTFRWPWSVIYAKEGPNDGMVSVSSAKWGEYRGTLLGVNHLDLIGWVNQLNYMMSSLTGKPIEFKPATFYLEMSDYLAEQGF
ncbi:hypothetical protein CspeluHIS016_0304900 [Cutaneotrichosporon spelunceum]|uniref:GPI inositol-deacylase n=1 Tax=Cutaneotrichosporon spelunceum TaxID=1672016 RepID=A0AAD3TUF1_9TREE|nr:hypothetical protein CspeluHIS016_0304900 [Cutaneotrichosporon spelunceum]